MHMLRKNFQILHWPPQPPQSWGEIALIGLILYEWFLRERRSQIFFSIDNEGACRYLFSCNPIAVSTVNVALRTRQNATLFLKWGEQRNTLDISQQNFAIRLTPSKTCYNFTLRNPSNDRIGCILTPARQPHRLQP